MTSLRHEGSPGDSPHRSETDRGRVAASGDQRGCGAGEVHPARASEHPAPLVGAAAAGGGAGGALRATGGRSVVPAGPLPDEGGTGGGTEAAVRDPAGTGEVGEHHERGTPGRGAGGDPGELAADLRGQRRPSPGFGTLRPGAVAGVPRSLRRGRGDPAGGAAAGAGSARLRPEPGGGAHQQGDDRDPAEVRGAPAGALLGDDRHEPRLISAEPS